MKLVTGAAALALVLAIGCGGSQKPVEEPELEEETVDDDGNPVAEPTEDSEETPATPGADETPGEGDDPDAEDPGDEPDSDGEDDADDASDDGDGPDSELSWKL